MLPEPRRRRRNNAQIRVRRNKAPLDLLYANFHTRTARRTTISSFVVFFRFLLPLREATLFCADGPRHSASRRIHTTTTKKKKAHSFPHEKFPDGPCVAECRLLSVDVHKHRRAGRFFLTIFTHFWPRIDSQKRFFSGTAKIAFFLFFGRLRTFAPFARARWWR